MARFQSFIPQHQRRFSIMDFFIRIRDGQPHEHPIVGDNFREAFPDIDPTNLPPEFASFTRVDPAATTVGFYEVLLEEYVWDGLGVRDNWRARPMTEEEHEARKQEGIENIRMARASMLDYAETQKAQATTPEAVSIWDAYITELTVYTYDDPVDARLPLPPHVLPDGTLADIYASGTAPNVID